MALLAVCPQIIIMHIIMAIYTVSKFQSIKNLKILPIPNFFLMTINTIYLLMFPNKPKPRIVMVKIISRRKDFHRMAEGAIIGRECILVIILMANDAILIQSQIGVSSVLEFRVGHVFRSMTIPTINAQMPTHQFISGQIMIEIIFIKTGHLKIAPVMFAMARGALFPLHLARSMIAIIQINTDLDFLMAIQTQIIRNFIPQYMALRTVHHALQFRMRCGQGAR